jgi:hypothetical protein
VFFSELEQEIRHRQDYEMATSVTNILVIGAIAYLLCRKPLKIVAAVVSKVSKQTPDAAISALENYIRQSLLQAAA